MLLHAVQEFDDDLGAWSDEDLTLSSLFCVVDGIERIVEDTGFDHDGDVRFSARWWEVRYLQAEKEVHISQLVLETQRESSHRWLLRQSARSPERQSMDYVSVHCWPRTSSAACRGD